MRRTQKGSMNVMSPHRLTQYAHGGGCACKISPGELEGLVRGGEIPGAPVFGELVSPGTRLRCAEDPHRRPDPTRADMLGRSADPHQTAAGPAPRRVCAVDPVSFLTGVVRVRPVTETIQVRERGRIIEFSFDDMMRYHGPGSPGGVANAFKVLQRAFAVLSPDQPPERRSIAVRTAFRGPGARDGFEAVTRAVSEDRYVIDLTLARHDRGRLLESFVFEVSIGERRVTLVLREGFVTEQFIDLAQKNQRTPQEEALLEELKAKLAEHIMATPAADVYELADPTSDPAAV